MKIKMLRTMHLHPEPHNSLTEPKGYEHGQEYDVDELHGRQWCHVGIAEHVAEQDETVPIGPVLK